MDKARFPQFYRKHLTPIYRFMYYRVGGNAELAQDLTQDVFLKALEAFERYDESVSTSSWIYTIARNHLITAMSKLRPQIDLEEIANTLGDGINWVERMATNDDERQLLRAMDELPPEDARLLREKHLEGWSYEEIGEREGKSPGALRVQAHRTLKRLRTILKNPKVC
ncbi:sigma-70 family RNA polymerase sigma factor [Candidatus Uhrbacteria bacterium]|nr:sigma-70 family RNA polymerase sigma factor [Candidatus Uhrbacteria bacterium]